MSPLGARFADYPTRVAAYAAGHGSEQLDLAYELGRSVVETGSELLAALELHDRGTLDALPALGEDSGTAAARACGRDAPAPPGTGRDGNLRLPAHR